MCELVQLEAGPCFVFASGLATPPAHHIQRSDRNQRDSLAVLNPGTWEADEWSHLLTGDSGPWAMAVSDGQVVSICHTPRKLLPNAAEAGVWTRPEFRGRGFGAAVTAGWAEILRPSGRHLFYSTSGGNCSSQRVADRLRLRLIGWQWSLWCGQDVVDFVRIAAGGTDADITLRLLRDVTEWGDAVAQVRPGHSGERQLTIYRDVPGQVFARVSPAEPMVVARRGNGTRVQKDLTVSAWSDVLDLLREAYEGASPSASRR